MSRRNLLGGLAVLATAPAVALAAPTPDAELIRICEAHPAVMDAVSDLGSGRDDCPYWKAYERSRDAIFDAKPVTMAGMLAKARAAKAEARTPSGVEDPDNSPAELWAWDLVNDLLRLEGMA